MAATEDGGALFRNTMIELAVLTFLIVAMVVSLVLLRKRPPENPT